MVVSGSSGHITASGNISSSATITGKKLFIDDDIFIGSSTDGTAPTETTRSIRFGAHTNDDIFIQGYHSASSSTLRLAVRDDTLDSIRIETVGHSGDRVDQRGNVKIQGGSITNTISGDSADSFNVQFENSSSSGRTFTNALFVSSSGNVSIGTTSPTHPLTVEGDISSSGVLRISTIQDANDAGASSDLDIKPQRKLNLGTSNSDEINIGRQSGTVDVNIYAGTSTTAARFITSTINFQVKQRVIILTFP